jgi:cytochrome c oxidase subunit 2
MFTLNDYSQNWQINFQDPATPLMEGIVDLHHDIMFFMCIVSIFVLYMLIRTVFLFHITRWRKGEYKFVKITHHSLIEILWTITPAFILAIIGLPSFALLYSMDQIIDPAITVKAIGHQWYWSYEYSDYTTASSDSAQNESINFDSYLIPEEDLEVGQLRLLEVDNPIYLPTHTHIRLLISSEDVLHSWTIPSFGIKVDACPGRLNQTSMYIQREGTFYGMCSEICGQGHSLMPICVKAVDLDTYIAWITSQYQDAE